MTAGHRIIEWVCTADHFRIARALRQDDQTPVFLKVLERDGATPAEFARLRREYEFLQSVKLTNVTRVLDYVADADAATLVFEYFASDTLDAYIERQRPDLASTLHIAMQLARALAHVHAAGAIYNDLRPARILISPAQDQLCLIGASRAVLPEQPRLSPGLDADLLDGDLAYVSPEQTGRLNRPVDRRTDLYSLGIILYQLLAGELPFSAHDLIEWVYCHLARVPRSPAEINPEVPPPLADMVMRLLAKAPEHRYQTAHGLLVDLGQCLRQWQREHRILPFDLGKEDAPDQRPPGFVPPGHNDRLDALAVSKLARALADPLSLDDQLDVLVRIALEHAGAQTAWLVLVRGNNLSVVAEAQVQERDVRVRTHTGLNATPALIPVGLLEETRRRRQPILLAEAATANFLATDSYVTARRPRSVLCVPILHQSDVIGLLYLENNLASNVFGPECLAVQSLVAAHAVLALENERLHASLAEGEERFRYIALAVRDAIYDWDTRTNKVWYNEAHRLRYSADQPVDEYESWWRQRIHPDDLERITRGLNRVFREHGQLWMEEYRLRRVDDDYATVIDHGYILYDPSGQPIRVIGAITDITELKQEEAALRDREERIRHLMESNIIGIFFWNLDGRVTDANEAFLQIVGYTREDLCAGNINWRQMTPPEFAAVSAHAVAEILATGRSPPHENEYVRKDGTHAPLLVGSTLLEGSPDQGLSFVLDLTERKHAEGRIRYMAHHDALTGLPNRLLLNDRVSQAIAQAHRSGQMVGMLFVDLDHFKHINDSLGHQIGDQLLRAVAHRLQRCVREGDSVARLGGDEFVIALPALTQSQDAEHVAQKALDSLGRSFIVDGNDLHVSGSIGISLYPNDGVDPDMLMRTADIAMYHAKESGRNNYQFFTAALNENAKWRHEMANRLHQALERDELVLHYQPQLDLANGKIVAAEALIRWRPPGAALVSCGEFLKVAEETGLILSIGEWALRQACRQVKRWRSNRHPDLRVAVNLSPRQFRQPRFYEQVTQVLDDCDLPGSALELEITENVLMLQNPENVLTLEKLFVRGVQISVDDFGMGYSSLAYLQRFPIHALKIDRSFVHGIGRNRNDTAIVKAVIAMGESMHLRVVAEGVETREQLEFLKQHHCTSVQGYYYSEALPVEQLTEVLDVGGRFESSVA